MTETVYDHKGTHATADIMLNSYPDDAIALFQESLKYCNLNVIAQKVHQFTEESATGVYVLAESSADIHEYPEVENGYICVSIFTCGEEGDPISAIDHFLSLLDVKDANVKCFNRGHFEKQSVDILSLGHYIVEEDLQLSTQKKLSQICQSLTSDQVKELQSVFNFVTDAIVSNE